MKTYIFFDRNPLENECGSRDICGEDYIKLIDKCFEYCSMFAFRVYGEEKFPEELEQYRVYDVSDEFLEAYNFYGHSHGTLYIDSAKQALNQNILRYYKVCPQTRDLFMLVTDSIFKWICAFGYNYPEDPAFFRADGSLFFDSTIHEGECSLMPKEEENVSDIIMNGKWYISRDGYDIEEIKEKTGNG
ncbi:MAG: hypothetical protein IKU25_07465 [Clostridia bacterium]|nr:hypothetical protein [Clostridia bacterium]